MILLNINAFWSPKQYNFCCQKLFCTVGLSPRHRINSQILPTSTDFYKLLYVPGYVCKFSIKNIVLDLLGSQDLVFSLSLAALCPSLYKGEGSSRPCNFQTSLFVPTVVFTLQTNQAWNATWSQDKNVLHTLIHTAWTIEDERIHFASGTTGSWPGA